MMVVLFDIDGTLIQTGGAGGWALMSAFSDVFGIAEPEEVTFCGRTDRGIARDLFQAHGVDDSQANWQRLQAEYLSRLQWMLPQRQGCVLPGIEPTLEQLAQRPDVAVGLLTGNLREGARLKLEHYGLMHHFAFGGFGDHHSDRDDVARSALAASRQHMQREIPSERVWVVGDTPLDVRCARAIGARAVAVATGWHGREELRDAEPDLLLDSLEQPTDLLDQLTWVPDGSAKDIRC